MQGLLIGLLVVSVFANFFLAMLSYLQYSNQFRNFREDCFKMLADIVAMKWDKRND